VNSINWARLMAQVVYYFYAAVRLGAPERAIAFSVPTGNFGDVFAGYVAAKMGLPVAKLIVATNVNDILHRALSDGDYSQGQVVPTATPSMDIQVSSNFERLLFDAGGRNGLALAEQMHGFETSKAMRLTNAQREGAAHLFSSARVDADGMTTAMRWAYDGAGQILDPHRRVHPGGDAGDGPSRQVPRCRGAGDRHPPAAPHAHGRPVRARGKLCQAARHVRGDHRLRRRTRDATRLGHIIRSVRAKSRTGRATCLDFACP
jgi:threonine synthase